MQPYQPAPKKKRHVLRWIFLAVVLVIVVIIIAAVASSGGKKNVATTGTVATSGTQTTAGAGTTAASAKASKAVVPAHVGTTINLKNGGAEPEQLAVTLVKVLNNAPPADEFSTPDPGNVYYAVQYRLVNTGTAAYSDSPSNGAVVVDAKGQQFQADIASDTKAGPSFPGAVTIIPGGNALGWITFEVPAGTVVTASQFALQSGFGSTGQWSIP